MKSLIFPITALSIALSAPVFAKKPDGDERFYQQGKSAEAKAKHKKSKKESAERHHLKKEKKHKHKQKKHHNRQEREHKKSDKYDHDRDDYSSERREKFERDYDQKRPEITHEIRPQVDSTKESVMQGTDAARLNQQINQDIPVRRNDLNPVDIIIDTNVNSLKTKVDKYHGQAVDAIDQETLKLKQSTETSSPWWDLFGDK